MTDPKPQTIDYLLLLGMVVIILLIVFHVVPTVYEGIQTCNEAAEKYGECAEEVKAELRPKANPYLIPWIGINSTEGG